MEFTPEQLKKNPHTISFTKNTQSTSILHQITSRETETTNYEQSFEGNNNPEYRRGSRPHHHNSYPIQPQPMMPDRNRPHYPPNHRPDRYRQMCTTSKEFALHAAAESGNIYRLNNILLDRSVRINCQKDGGWTALMIASYNNRSFAIENLINQGANINLVHGSGATALSFAFEKNHYMAASTLLRRGANPRVGFEGRTAIDEARKIETPS